MKADVVIIGGGINGCSLAYRLAKEGMDVAVLEKSYLASGATGRCGAGIRQQFSIRENAVLAIESVKIFERLEEELGGEIDLRQGGYLIAIHDDKELDEAEKNVQMQRSLGLEVSILDADEINDIVPILDVNGMEAIAATFCPTDGHADPFKTTDAYARAARENGARIHTFTRALDIEINGKSVSAVKTDKGKIKTNVVVNAAGAWSKKVAEMAGIKLPNQPYRKEILVTERLKPIFEAMVISFKDGIYFSQQREGQILGGIPIKEEKPGYYQNPTFSFLKHMSTTLTRYAPSLKHLKVLRQWTGFYDVTPDARPILGEVDGLDGFIQCNGFSGHGFMVSPIVAKLLAELIINGKTPIPIDSFNLRRFKEMKLEREKGVVG